MHTTLISTDALADHLADGWAVLDCRYDLKDDAWGRAQYLRVAHSRRRLRQSFATTCPRLPTAPTAAIPSVARGDDRRHSDGSASAPGTQVVLYDQDDGRYASRLWWMLRYMGHEAAAVLDGGWAKWTREGRPVRSGEETRPRATFEGRPRQGARLQRGRGGEA